MLIRDVGRNKLSECKVQSGSGFTERLDLALQRGKNCFVCFEMILTHRTAVENGNSNKPWGS